MAKNKTSDLAKWIIVALALLTLAFNSGILYNDVRHFKANLAEFKEDTKAELVEIKQDIKSINMYLLQKSKDE